MGKRIQFLKKNKTKQNFFDFFWHFFWQSDSGFVLGRPGTEEFVPVFLLLLLSRDSGTRNFFLSRDKGTAGQGNFFVPRQRDNGTSRPGLSQDVPREVPFLGNPSQNVLGTTLLYLSQYLECLTQSHFLYIKNQPNLSDYFFMLTFNTKSNQIPKTFLWLFS